VTWSHPLPIDEALPALCAALRTRTAAVLEAPPGAGKTTRVPLALLGESWLDKQRLVMLEPRRLAARAAAHYMARTLGEQVGATVGYRVRGETRVSSRTRIEVVTEGVLARLLSSDPTLEGYGAVLFDEYHERSLHADLGLALTLEAQQVRDDLRVLVMSATLDGDAVAALIGTADSPAPVVRSAGRMFPIETHYRPPRADEKIEAATARVVREALDACAGDVLVFLPGLGEQRRVAERLDEGRRSDVRVHVLHGSMPLAEQDAALAPAPSGVRKVVLSTSVAETSLTVVGVRIVVDAGLSRVPAYDAAAGLTRLRTVRVSRASADQRRGRAGRTAPGVCYRLWDAHEEHGFLASTPPEILSADLASLALELADAGVTEPSQLRWLDVPRAAPFAQARTLLAQLGALDATGRITEHGKRMAALPLSPRLAHLVLAGAARGSARLACTIAALVEERDLLRAERGVYGDVPADLRLRVEVVARHSDSVMGARVERDGVRRVRQAADDLWRKIAGERGSARPVALDDADTGALLALAYPDRVAQRRPGSEPRYLLRNGSGAALLKQDALHEAPYLAIAELEGQPPEYRIARAAPLTLEEIREDFREQFVREQVVSWDERTRRVQAVERVMLGALVLEERPWRDADPVRVRGVVIEQLARAGVGAWPLSAGARRLRERLAFLHHAIGGDWPEVSDEALTSSLDEWLGPFLDNVRSWGQLEALDWHEALASLVPWSQRAALDRLAPTHLEVPSGSRIAVDYGEPAAPVLAVKLQEVFGWTSTPLLADGRVPLTLHLLSPAQRPVQVTRDLAGFWKSSYFAVRKELRGRYPRHPWPEDPLTAEATRRAKPRGT
jgi:ATP-dependent helicase HrpB